MLPELKWDLVPFAFLYDLYKAWVRKYSPCGMIQGRNTFINEVVKILPEYNDWYCIGRTTPIRPANKMDSPEPLILDYDLIEWKNPNYTGPNPDMICKPILKVSYRGILRGTKP